MDANVSPENEREAEVARLEAYHAAKRARETAAAWLGVEIEELMDAGSFAFPEEADAAVKVNDPVDMTADLVRIPGDMAYWTAAFAEAERGVQTLKVEIKVAEGRAWLAARKRQEMNGKKPTDKTTEAMVAVDEAVVTLRTALAEYVAKRKHLEGIVDAIKTKRDMLITLGANQRKEMDALNASVRA